MARKKGEAIQSSRVPSVPDPNSPLTVPYTYHSPRPTAKGPYILGVDEAGRGPVLGPLVYGVAYCPASYQEQLDDLGFAGVHICNIMPKTIFTPGLSRFKDPNCCDAFFST